jgi:hypothetical protein
MYHPHKVSLAEVAHHQQESNFDVKKFMASLQHQNITAKEPS